jgi:aryl-alcohol dehydrogenase-like predicted oxidoreductase
MVSRIERSPLDRTRLLVSSLGMGYARLGAIWQERSDKDVREALALALIAGKNVFDPTGTVERSERVLGSAFQGIRDEFIVATKCGLIGTPSTFLNHLVIFLEQVRREDVPIAVEFGWRSPARLRNPITRLYSPR